MFDKLTKLLLWCVCISILLSNFLFFCMFFNKLSDGVLGFAGAIIGGFLTLAGVSYQIKRSDNDRFLETYFRKIITIDRALGILNPLININSNPYNTTKFGLLVENIESIEEACKIIETEIGGDISVQLYYLLKAYKRIQIDDTNLNQVRTITILSGPSPDWSTYNQELVPYVQKYYGYLTSMISHLNGYKERLASKYHSITKY